jgi:hypothetical protein
VIRRATLALAVALVACTGASGTSGTPAVTTTPAASAPAAHVPPGVPPSFGDAVGAQNVPVAALVPLKGRVTGSWSTSTATGDAIVVAWEMPGRDPFRLNRGVVAWRRSDDEAAPWRPVWGEAFAAGAEQPVLGIDAKLADVTSDGSADVLVTASLGGSGGCAIVIVIDLAAGTAPYRSRGCDRTIEPSSDPAGLRVREAVYATGDPHCCPSGFRDTVLVYDGGTWRTESTSVEPA